ncbi:Major facilitator superfamily transporter [Apiospora marii]|uniref:Major facilitator superfamily transporter n=1 Tax=Apiospora marii TaxID=335849 RepID=A0ABR1T2A6_9PEZI
MADYTEPKEENVVACPTQPPTPVPPPRPYTKFSKVERRVIVALIALAAWFSTLSSFIYYPAISSIAEDLESTIGLVNLTVTSYLVVSAVAPAIVGDAADTLGRRPLYAVTLTLYVAANIGIASQRSFVALLILRMLQSAGISGTFSVAYGVLADIAAPSERGSFVSALSFGITTAPSIGPVIGGAMASGPGWRWIFWFLAIVSGICLALMILLLPETNRALLSHPLLPGVLRPWTRKDNAGIIELPPRALRIPNPLKSLVVLSRRDVAVSIMPGSFLYTVYCCIHTSLSTSFVEVYHLDYLRAGFVYLPFGVGAIISTIVSGRWIDRDYRIVAQSHGLPINKVSGDDLLHFPIEEARLRSVFLPILVALISVVTYGWLVHHHVHMAGPLICLFLAGLSIQTCFNINNTLLVDINEDVPATAQASSNIVRCIMSAVLVGTLQITIDEIGFGWAFTLLGSFCLLAGFFYFIERMYGRKWRLARHVAGT